MKTFLDKRFDQFVGYINEIFANELPSELFFCGRTVTILPGESDGTSQLLSVYLDGKSEPYSLADTLEAKGRLAKDGYLGIELIRMGQRAYAAVEARKKREYVHRLFKEFEKLWGEYASRVWHMKLRESQRPKIAKAVLALLAHSEAKDAKSIEDAKNAGANLPWLEAEEWRTVKLIADKLWDYHKSPY